MSFWEVLNSNFVVSLVEAVSTALLVFVLVALPVMQRLKAINARLDALNIDTHITKTSVKHLVNNASKDTDKKQD